MTTVVLNEENRPFFQPLFSPDVWETLEKPGVIALGAVLDEYDIGIPGTAVGVLAAESGEDTLRITWIYVAPDQRMMGAASMLLQVLTRSLHVAPELRRICAMIPDEPECRELLILFERHGFSLGYVTGSTQFRVTVGEYVKAMHGRSTASSAADSELIPFLRLPQPLLDRFNREYRGVAAVELPIQKEEYLPCSVCAIRANRLTGLLLFRKATDESAVLSFVWAGSGERKIAARMLLYAAPAVSRLFPEDSALTLATATEASRVIAQHISAGAAQSRAILANRKLGEAL